MGQSKSFFRTLLGEHSCKHGKQKRRKTVVTQIWVNLKSGARSANPIKTEVELFPHVGHRIGDVPWILHCRVESRALMYWRWLALLATVGVALSRPSVSSSHRSAFMCTVAAHTRSFLTLPTVPTHIQPVSLFRISCIICCLFLWHSSFFFLLTVLEISLNIIWHEEIMRAWGRLRKTKSSTAQSCRLW